MIITTRVVTSRSRDDEDRFAGWLSLFQLRPRLESRQRMHELSSAAGLGLRQWSRDLFIPRGWR